MSGINPQLKARAELRGLLFCSEWLIIDFLRVNAYYVFFICLNAVITLANHSHTGNKWNAKKPASTKYIYLGNCAVPEKIIEIAKPSNASQISAIGIIRTMRPKTYDFLSG